MARPTARPAPPIGGGLVTAAPTRPLLLRVASSWTNLLLSAPTMGTYDLPADWKASTTVESMPEVQIPSNWMPELKMSFICWAAGPVGERLLDDMDVRVRGQRGRESLVAVGVRRHPVDATHLDDVALAVELLREPGGAQVSVG